jgi:hypothetical protein
MPPFFLLRDDVSSELTRPCQLHSEAYVTSGYHIVTAQSIENLRIPMTYGPVSLLYLRDFRHLHSLNIARSRAVSTPIAWEGLANRKPIALNLQIELLRSDTGSYAKSMLV